MRYVFLVFYLCILVVGYSHACDKGAEVVKENEKRQFLRGHKKARLQAGVRKVFWDKGLAEVAENHARHLAQKCSAPFHSKGHSYGENISVEFGSKPATRMGVVESWVKEKRFSKTPKWCSRGECRTYSQVVWQNIMHIGCGSASCTEKSSLAKKTYFVCNYNPSSTQ